MTVPVSPATRCILGASAVALLFCVLAQPAPARQSDPPLSPDQALEQLQRALANEPGLSPETRRAFRDFADAIHGELSSSRRGPAAGTTPPADDERIEQAVDARIDARLAEHQKYFEHLERLRVYGDIRFRHESTFNVEGSKDRHRQRIRFRLGVDYRFNNEVLLGAGVRTGDPNDPNSPYVTLGDGFNDFDVSLDRAFLTWKPEWAAGSWLTGGKFVNPIARNPVYGELVWDADVNPEGVLLGWKCTTFGGFESVNALLGAYTVLEDGRTDDVRLIAGQLSGQFAVGENANAMIGVGYSWYDDPTPDGIQRLLGGNAGNAVRDTNGDMLADEFVSSFGILNPIVSLTFDTGGLPLTLAAEYIYNTRANIDADRGWALGAALGRTSKPGDWKAYYQWQVVEQDAVFSAFTQDDFVYQTNFRGHVFGCKYVMAPKLDLNLWGLVARRDQTAGSQTDEDTWRLRADLTFAF